MKNSRLAAFLIIAIVTLGSSIAGAQAPQDISGTWVGKTEVPDGGPDQITLVLKSTEDGYSGTIDDSLAMISAGTAIKNVKLEKGVLSFTFPLTDGTEVALTVTVDGEKMTGGWSHSEGATGQIAFEKQKRQ